MGLLMHLPWTHSRVEHKKNEFAVLLEITQTACLQRNYAMEL